MRCRRLGVPPRRRAGSSAGSADMGVPGATLWLPGTGARVVLRVSP